MAAEAASGGTTAGADGTAFQTTLSRLRSLCPTVSVGILAADLMRLGSELDMLEHAGVGVIHVDVMDGCFCPQLTVGPLFVKALRTPLFKDVHLMIHEPLDKLAAYAAAGADMITVHLESAVHIHRVLQRLGSLEHATGPGRGIVRGLALNPGTPLEWLTAPLLDEVDVITLLAIDPGWSGQRFAPTTLERLGRLKEMLRVAERDTLVCVDGGVSRENVREIAAAGPDLIAGGSVVFDGEQNEANAAFALGAVQAAKAR
jgi:ribulose-phosphate 3-epimerase